LQNNSSSNHHHNDGGGREGVSERLSPDMERLLYLRQAFVAFFRSRKGVEMQHFGRVICAILRLDEEEQNFVMTAVDKLAPALEEWTVLDALRLF
jgi:hypothetical protein